MRACPIISTRTRSSLYLSPISFSPSLPPSSSLSLVSVATTAQVRLTTNPNQYWHQASSGKDWHNAHQVEVKFEPPPPALHAIDPYTTRVVALSGDVDEDAMLLATQMHYELKASPRVEYGGMMGELPRTPPPHYQQPLSGGGSRRQPHHTMHDSDVPTCLMRALRNPSPPESGRPHGVETGGRSAAAAVSLTSHTHGE